ncbi:hypothetical protein ACWGLO_20055 [Streptomyces niveus]
MAATLLVVVTSQVPKIRDSLSGSTHLREGHHVIPPDKPAQPPERPSMNISLPTDRAAADR